MSRPSNGTLSLRTSDDDDNDDAVFMQSVFSDDVIEIDPPAINNFPVQTTSMESSTAKGYKGSPFYGSGLKGGLVVEDISSSGLGGSSNKVSRVDEVAECQKILQRGNERTAMLPFLIHSFEELCWQAREDNKGMLVVLLNSRRKDDAKRGTLLRNSNVRNQKKSIGFQADDVVILQGYPKVWQTTELLNVLLVVKRPQDASNDLISRETLSQLLVTVAPEIQRQMGHRVAYIDDTEITSVSPDASGRKSGKPKSLLLHRSALIALGAALAVVLLVAVIMIVWYHRKKNSEKADLKQTAPVNQEENIRLMEL